MKKGFLLLLLFCITAVCYSQEVDSTYIGFYDSRFSLKPFFAQKYLSLVQELPDGDIRHFMSNNPMEIGAGISVNNTFISFAYGYGFNFLRDKKYGDTKSFDVQFHSYGRKYAFDIFFQKYKGFYFEDEKIDDVAFLAPDLRIDKYGVYGEYVFNGNKFSYGAAFDQSEKQLKSAGSFLLGGGIYYTNIRSDSSFVFNGSRSVENFQIGVSGGYAQTWVLSKHYFISGAATLGMSFGNKGINRIGKDKPGIYPSVMARISTGLNYPEWSFGFSYVNNLIFTDFSDTGSVGINSGHFQLTVTKRFDASVPIIEPVLSKFIK